MMFHHVLALTALLGGALVDAHDDNGLARTPQMGWNSFYPYGCWHNEERILGTARKLVSSGLVNYGYNYVLIDDCWQADERDPKTGAPVAHSGKFPHGIKYIADKVHALGLKVGIYSNAGKYTCVRTFGSLGYEEIDAQTFADWGIDYLKYDNCFNEGQAGTDLLSFERFARMSRALNATGRPILYSMCNWGEDGPWNWAATIANSWRISGDIVDEFDRFDDRCPCTSILNCKLAGVKCSMTRVIDYAASLGTKAGPGRWNDLDMLQVGGGGMTHDEYITHFTMWALLKSPLILGFDLYEQGISDETFSIITNDALIAVNQDSVGYPTTRVWKRPLPEGGDLQFWSGYLANGGMVAALMNTSPRAQKVTVSIPDIFVDNPRWMKEGTYRFFDLWQKDEDGKWGKDVGVYHIQGPKVTVAPHLTKVWKLIPVNRVDTPLALMDHRNKQLSHLFNSDECHH